MNIFEIQTPKSGTTLGETMGMLMSLYFVNSVTPVGEGAHDYHFDIEVEESASFDEVTDCLMDVLNASIRF